MDYFNQETERLILRKCQKEDIPKWESFFVDNPNLPYIGVDLNLEAKVHAKAWIENQFKRYVESGFGHLAIVSKSNNLFMGCAGIIPRTVNDKIYHEIAYSLKQEFWRKGYGTEVAQQLLKFGVQHKIADNFVSIIHVDNIGSKKVAQRNGMQVLFETVYLDMPVEVFGTTF